MDATDIDLDLDCNFEPQTRARSNTWPLRPSRELDPQSSPVPNEDVAEQPGGNKDPLGLTAKKSGSRRNAWGNLSYADLITKAIQSSPESRLTLSQIYDWMVQNVPFFKDKGDSTSSAGWKNSIRHNLSLHNRFMRIQNEGTGKSSWWVINPDAKPGKTPRRRAGSMETKSYEKKRGRVRKKVEALRASLENGGTLSPSLSEDYLDAFSDFRPRASSNASSCGRLSPIHAVPEPDLHDSQVPPMSPSLWSTDMNQSPTIYPGGDCYSDLVDSLGDGMKLSSPDTINMMNNIRDPYISGAPQDYGTPQTPNFLLDRSPKGVVEGGQFTHLPAPPPYPKSQQQQQVDFQQNYSGLRLQLRSSPGGGFQPSSDMYEPIQEYSDKQEIGDQQQNVLSPLTTSNTLIVTTQQQQLNSPDRSQQGSPSSGSFAHLSPQPGLVNGHGGGPQQSVNQLSCQQLSPQPQNPHLPPPPQSMPSLQRPQPPTQQEQQQQQQAAALQLQATQASILREALTRGSLSFRSPTTANTSSLNNFSPVAIVSPLGNNNNTPISSMNSLMMGMGGLGGLPNGGGGSLIHSMTTGQQIRSLSDNFPNHPVNHPQCSGDMVHGMGVGNMNNGNMQNAGMPVDIDVDLISGLDYDMDSVIKQELLMEGNLDFNFDSGPPTSAGQNVVH